MRVLTLSFYLYFLVGCNGPSTGGSGSSVCGVPRDDSTALKLDGGIEGPADGGTAAAPSYLLSFENDDGDELTRCTGTAVSSSTIITAAHCVADQGVRSIDLDHSRKELGLDVCISRDDAQPAICSNLVYFDSGWRGNSERDIAWIAFPLGTFKDYYEVSGRSSTVGKQLIAVGYGPGSSGRPPTLRYGITSFLSADGQSGTFLSQYDDSPTFDQVKLVHGDSGGPVLDDCKLGGVASMYRSDNHNVYVDLGSQSIRTTLKNVSGRVDSNTNAYVHFCGLSVVYEDDIREPLCPAAGLNVVKFPTASAQQRFPCVRQAISPPKAPDPEKSESVTDHDDTGSGGVCQEPGN